MDKEELGRSHFIDLINSPQDLRLLSKHQLKLLARELRNIIIDIVSKTGGFARYIFVTGGMKLAESQ